MEAFEVLLSRRSVRNFENQSVDTACVDKILQAAMSAPSAGNQQAWHFIVVTDRDLLNQLGDVHFHAKMCQQAPIAIIPCVDTKLIKHALYWPQDLSAASQNILLAIRAQNLGGVWLGIYPDEDRVQKIKQLFNLSSDIIPFCMIPFGHTSTKQGTVDRFQKDRVHDNHW